MATPTYYPRFAEPRLTEALADTPVVLIHGPRQCGKTTLARRVGEARGYSYFNLDDDVALAAAKSDPIGFVDDLPDRVILDEVQRAPGLFTAIKRAVDRHRTPGRFILTGSANVLLLPRLADSLAGRMEIMRLHPLSQSELADRPSQFLDRLFAGAFKTRTYERLGVGLAERVAAHAGGRHPPAKTVKKWRATTDSGHAHPVAPHTLNRQFAVTSPNRVWAGDITYVWTAEGWLSVKHLS